MLDVSVDKNLATFKQKIKSSENIALPERNLTFYGMQIVFSSS